MFDRFRTLLDSFTSADGGSSLSAENDPKVAFMALCLQVIEADGLVLDSEKRALKDLIQTHYGLNDSEYDRLKQAGEAAEQESVDYYRFTSVLKKALNPDQHAEIIGLLWDIVYADGERSELEDNIVWRVAELLSVPGRVRIMKRQEALARLNAQGAGTTTESDDLGTS
jgi:uncharacterized tellurite resistance protein B-like protein